MSATGHDHTKDVCGTIYSGAFEGIYRSQLDAVAGFFARRARDAQTVADLTAETFVQALGSFTSARYGREALAEAESNAVALARAALSSARSN
jgi:hypothetical protein